MSMQQGLAALQHGFVPEPGCVLLRPSDGHQRVVVAVGSAEPYIWHSTGIGILKTAIDDLGPELFPDFSCGSTRGILLDQARRLRLDPDLVALRRGNGKWHVQGNRYCGHPGDGCLFDTEVDALIDVLRRG